MSADAATSPTPTATAVTDARTTRRGRMVPKWAGPAPVLAAWTIALVAAGIALRPHAPRPALGCFLFGIMPALYLVIAGVHELGHVIAGRATGWRFLGLVVGPLSVSHTGGRLVFEANRSWTLAGGIALMAPLPGRVDTPRAAIPMLAGGPLASLALGLVGVALREAIGVPDVSLRTVAAGTHTLGQLLADASTFILGVGSLAIAGATMIPNAIGGFTSDGAAIRILARGGAPARRLLGSQVLIGAATAGTRPRDWEPARVADTIACDDGSAIEYGARYLAFLHAMDAHDLPAMRAHLARMTVAGARAAAIMVGGRHLAAAWVAVLEGRLADARAAWAASEGTMVEDHDRDRVRAAIELAEGRTAAGIATARAALAALDASPEAASMPGFTAMHRDQLVALAEGRVPGAVAPAA